MRLRIYHLQQSNIENFEKFKMKRKTLCREQHKKEARNMRSHAKCRMKRKKKQEKTLGGKQKLKVQCLPGHKKVTYRQFDTLQ